MSEPFPPPSPTGNPAGSPKITDTTQRPPGLVPPLDDDHNESTEGTP